MADLKDKLANKAQETKTGVAPKKPEQTIADLLKRMGGEIQRALPKHMTADRLSRIALTTIRLNPKLLECNQASLIGAVMQAAQLGLEPGILGQCYLIPYRNNKQNTTECQFQISYKGYIELLRRTGQVAVIEAHDVHENDEFDYEYGSNSHITFKPNLKGERGAAYCYYAYAKLKDGSESFIVMGTADINRIRDKYSKSKNYGPWVDEYDAMAKKTVLKQLVKYLPLSVEIMKDLAQDETTKAEIKEDMNEVLDIGYMAADHVQAQDVEYTETQE
jgi:recombination protein RecT